jgi:hypothetical protein
MLTSCDNHYSVLGWKLTRLPPAQRVWIRSKQLACQSRGEEYHIFHIDVELQIDLWKWQFVLLYVAMCQLGLTSACDWNGIQGGGWCNDVSSCVFRKGSRRGSSNHMERQLQFTGIMSNRPEENPGIVLSKSASWVFLFLDFIRRFCWHWKSISLLIM